MKLSDRTYDILKTIDEILILLAAFYVDFAETWGLPYGAQMQKTLLDLATLLLGFLKISTAKYHKDLAGIDDIVYDLEGQEEDEVGLG